MLWFHSATSPIARMAGSLVRHWLSTTTPPRSPISRPQSRANWSRGRMPAENTIRSVSSTLSSWKTMRWRLASPSSIRCVARSRSTCTPSASIFSRSSSPPSLSTCMGIRREANSTTAVSRFNPRRAFAASRPSKPPPTTTPVVAFSAAA